MIGSTVADGNARMLFDNPRTQYWLRWLGLPPIALIAVFLAFNLVTPFRVMHKMAWPDDSGPAGVLVFVAVDALLMLAPLIVVVVFAAWLTAPAWKIETLRITEVLLVTGCIAAMLLRLVEGHWQGVMVLGFGAMAAVITAAALVRYERRQARGGAEEAEA